MKICKVNSLPLKEVIKSLAECIGVDYKESCGEYYLKIPSALGKGQIRGINFDNGLGIIIYQCEFYEDFRVDFTVDDVHPVKYIYSVKGPIKHRFANEKKTHEIEQYKCAIVASESNNGHILSFEKEKEFEIISLEIDRKRFIENSRCQIEDISDDLQKLFKDFKADHTFYHEGFYGLEFKTLLDNVSKYQDQKLVRKFFLESIGLQMFVNQLLQYRDDKLGGKESTILRINEVKQAETISTYISQNLDEELTVVNLSKLSGLNPNKLQKAFKYLYNTTVNEYVTMQRLDRAQELLSENDFNVSEVVSIVGFKSFSYFSKIFKEKYKISPSVFKELKN